MTNDKTRLHGKLIWKLVLVVATVLAGAYIQVVFNPIGLGIAKSSRFSWARFEQVKRGQTIGEVIELLGEPIRAPEVLEVTEPDDICFPTECRIYLFFGLSYSGWPVLGYREAIVVVGPDGGVVSAVSREE